VPFLDIVEETVNELPRLIAPGASVAVLATRGTQRAGLYETQLSRAGFRVIELSDDQQLTVDSAISLVKGGEVIEATQRLNELAQELNQVRAAAIVAACTELALALDTQKTPLPVIDSGASLAAAVVAKFKRALPSAPPPAAAGQLTKGTTCLSH